MMKGQGVLTRGSKTFDIELDWNWKYNCWSDNLSSTSDVKNEKVKQVSFCRERTTTASEKILSWNLLFWMSPDEALQ